MDLVSFAGLLTRPELPSVLLQNICLTEVFAKEIKKKMHLKGGIILKKEQSLHKLI